MSTKRKVILVLIVGLSMLLVVLVGGLAWYGYDSTNYTRHIARAEKYLSAGDTENAILEYQVAINMKPESEDAYLKLAEIYSGLGQNTMAQSVLTKGFNATGSNRITRALAVYAGNGIQEAVNVVEGGEGAAPDMILFDGEGEGINTELLSVIGSTEYNDLRNKYTVDSNASADGGCMVRLSSMGANLHYDKKSTDSSGRKPLGSAEPDQAVLDNILSLFYGKKGVTEQDLSYFGAENIGTYDDASHGKVITFVSGACMVTVSLDANGTISSGAWHSIVPLSQTEYADEAGSCTANGKVLSSTTGGNVVDAELRFREGDKTFGEIIQTVRSDSFGGYSILLNPGEYTVEVQCVGYTTEFFPIEIGFTDYVTLDDIYISPLLGDGQIRIVLEWGSSPSDLDSHLEGNVDGGGHIHTFFSQQKEVRNGETVAELDLDDTDGYGPETTTIYNTNGVYTFKVIDFTGSGTMSNSGAVVKIYLPDGSAPIEVNICSGLNNEWNVCTIDHGKVTVNNR
ncbi:MAG: tetratricopeptide repeat protein [Lachnospiraceae bacterium]|nr:tetratricopeptide repeat protein [Lachnospiraceae bacterium]